MGIRGNEKVNQLVNRIISSTKSVFDFTTNKKIYLGKNHRFLNITNKVLFFFQKTRLIFGTLKNFRKNKKHFFHINTTFRVRLGYKKKNKQKYDINDIQAKKDISSPRACAYKEVTNTNIRKPRQKYTNKTEFTTPKCVIKLVIF